MDHATICTAAKSAFELRVNGSRASLPKLSNLQGRIAVWQDYNFGVGPAWHKAMGVAEEAFELCESILELTDSVAHAKRGGSLRENAHDTLDAIADIAVYSMSFCTSIRTEYHTLWELSDRVLIPQQGFLNLDLRIAALKVCASAKPIQHAVLKNAQSIRGFDDQAKFVTVAACGIGATARASQFLCEMLEHDFVEIVENVAENVLKRDWKKNPVHAAAIVDNK